MKKEDLKILIPGIVIGLILINIFLIPEAFRGDKFNASSASQYGSFVGGYVGAFFSFISIVILYITLKNQHESSEIEKFESKYFELIKLHRDNVSEIDIKDNSGRKVFVTLLREYREIYDIVGKLLIDNQYQISEHQKINMAYLIFFYGVGPNSSRILKDALSQFDPVVVNDIVKKFDNRELKVITKRNRQFKHTPFEGHQSRLGHYYRHIYQTVTYVDSQSIKIDKYGYVKILRAQLSTHEQALLFLNSLSDLGKNWKTSKLILKYRLIKNLPKNFFDEVNEINVKNEYPDLVFEWEE